MYGLTGYGFNLFGGSRVFDIIEQIDREANIKCDIFKFPFKFLDTNPISLGRDTLFTNRSKIVIGQKKIKLFDDKLCFTRFTTLENKISTRAFKTTPNNILSGKKTKLGAKKLTLLRKSNILCTD